MWKNTQETRWVRLLMIHFAVVEDWKRLLQTKIQGFLDTFLNLVNKILNFQPPKNIGLDSRAVFLVSIHFKMTCRFAYPPPPQQYYLPLLTSQCGGNDHFIPPKITSTWRWTIQRNQIESGLNRSSKSCSQLSTWILDITAYAST